MRREKGIGRVEEEQEGKEKGRERERERKMVTT
jgi:hypothetical protein